MFTWITGGLNFVIQSDIVGHITRRGNVEASCSVYPGYRMVLTLPFEGLKHQENGITKDRKKGTSKSNSTEQRE